MVMLRPTRKLRTTLPVTDEAGVSDTALGDWYINRLVVGRRPLLLLVSSTSLLPMVLPARDVRGLPSRVGALVAGRLSRLGVARHLIAAEQRAMTVVRIGVTRDRSVLGIMVDFAKSLPYYLENEDSDDTSSLAMAEDRLAETPCYAGGPSDRVVFPDKKAPQLLATKWAG